MPEGLMFPKTRGKKKRKSHPKSILHEKDGTCYLCMLLHDDYRVKTTQEHHIFFGSANRRLSEEYGLKVYLCAEKHHEHGKESVHENEKNRRLLEEIAQRAFEEAYPKLNFMKIFGKNCIEEPENVEFTLHSGDSEVAGFQMLEGMEEAELI